MAGRQTGGGIGMNRVNLRAVREIPPFAGGQNLHFPVHNFHGDAAKIFVAEQLSFMRKRKRQRYDGERENRHADNQIHH